MTQPAPAIPWSSCHDALKFSHVLLEQMPGEQQLELEEHVLWRGRQHVPEVQGSEQQPDPEQGAWDGRHETQTPLYESPEQQ